MKKCLLILHIVFFSVIVTAQVSKSTDLYQTIKEKDSLLFNLGFNDCDIMFQPPISLDTYCSNKT
jgi:hypothetical protein